MARPVVQVGPSLGRLPQHALYTTLCVTRCSSPAPFLASLFSLSVHFRSPSPVPNPGSPGAWGGGVCGGGLGGGVDAGIRPRPPVFPLGGGGAMLALPVRV